jgi:hypothetical protein
MRTSPCSTPVLSGDLKMSCGWGPPFEGMIILDVVAITMYYFFFPRGKRRRV